MKLKITLLCFLLCSVASYSQSQYINNNFGEDGFTCINTAAQSRIMADLLEVNDEYYGITSQTEHYLVKISSNGNVVTSFGNNGLIPLEMGLGESGIGYTNAFIRLTPDNHLLMAVNFDGSLDNAFIAKTDLNGNIIESFGNDGYVAREGNDRINFHTVEIVNNEIIMIGTGMSYAPDNSDKYIIMLKYDLDGNPVASFGDDGALTLAIDEDMSPKKIHYFPESGDILVLADQFDQEGYYTFLAKYDMASGLPDTSFGENGYVYYYSSENEHILPNAILVQNNSIYVAGSVDDEGGSGDYELFIKKMGLDGQLDANFGTQGTFLYDITETDLQVVQSINVNAGKITLTGTFYADSASGEKIFLLQTSSNGTLNTAFGNGGIISTPTILAASMSTYKTIVDASSPAITVATTSTACSTNSTLNPTVIQFSSTALATAPGHEMQPIKYFPNPVTGSLYFEGENIDTAEVYDVLGKLVYSASPKHNTLDISRLQSGIYLIKVFVEGNTRNIKIIKE